MGDILDAVSEVKDAKDAKDDELRAVIERWFDATHTKGLKLGARMICATVLDVIQKNITTKEKPSLRDYRRAIEEILKIIQVPLTQQNDEQGGQ